MKHAVNSPKRPYQVKLDLCLSCLILMCSDYGNFLRPRLVLISFMLRNLTKVKICGKILLDVVLYIIRVVMLHLTWVRYRQWKRIERIVLF